MDSLSTRTQDEREEEDLADVGKAAGEVAAVEEQKTIAE